jgi:hypothetical protein
VAQCRAGAHHERGLPAGYLDSWCFRRPVVEMPVYLELLVSRLQAAGGGLTRMALATLPVHCDVVVNCTGLGSRLLADDLGCASRTWAGAAGAAVRAGTGLARRGPIYVVPRGATSSSVEPPRSAPGTGARTLPWRGHPGPGQRAGPELAAAPVLGTGSGCGLPASGPARGRAPGRGRPGGALLRPRWAGVTCRGLCGRGGEPRHQRDRRSLESSHAVVARQAPRAGADARPRARHARVLAMGLLA